MQEGRPGRLELCLFEECLVMCVWYDFDAQEL